MPQYTVVGTIDPLLVVQLEQGSEVIAESDAMVSMDANLSLKGKATGGVMSSLKRAVLQSESLFQQHITAPNGPGQVTLAPTVPGDVRLLDVGARQYHIADGCFLAGDASVEIKHVSQGSVSKGLFGGTGGFFVMETAGTGKVAIGGFGSMHEMEVQPGKEFLVDNGHVVAWDKELDYEMSMSTSESSGFFSKLINSQTSGEGLVLRFKGRGKVFICSRNRGSFLGWIFANAPATKK